MSEYQYYAFQAIDRPLDKADCKALRELSSRARITSVSFTNHYDWGDFGGDPKELMARWFDLHLYLANWGTRRLTIRWPKRLLDHSRLGGLLDKIDGAELQVSGENLILDIWREEMDYYDWDDDEGRLAELAPLRSDVLQGDLRLFYLLWLMAVETDDVGTYEQEPLPGLGPITSALEAFADFFGIDPDLIEAAAERPAEANGTVVVADAARQVITAMSDDEKTGLLVRLFEGDLHLGAELKLAVRARLATKPLSPPVARRTAGELRTRAEAIRLAREQAAAEREAAEQRRKAEAEQRARRARLGALAQRGEGAWDEVEAEIERRNPKGYDRAADLLLDLQLLAVERGLAEEFTLRLREMRDRHAGKWRFIERLDGLAQLGAL